MVLPLQRVARRSPGPIIAERCYLCGSSRLQLRFPERRGAAADTPPAYACTSLGHKSHPPIWGCCDCGVLLQSPMLAEPDLIEAYRAVEDPLYEAERMCRYVTFRRVLRHLGPGGGRRLLDVGAYCGYFVDVAREGGYEAEGLELSSWAAERARALGLAVHTESLAARLASGATYDVVTMFDVIEHMADPRTELADVFRLLPPGGRLYLSTIDADSLFARVLGRHWPWLMDMHLYYFTRQTITMLLNQAGFEIQGIGLYTHVVSAGYLLQKAAATFPGAERAVRLLGTVVPGRLHVPINLGDNMLVSAVRRV